MEDKLKELLLRSLDAELSPAERRSLDRGLAGSSELREEREELLRIRAGIQSLFPEPDPGFHARLMRRLPGQPGFTAMIVNLFPKVAAACLILIVLTLLGTYLSSGNLSADAIIGLQDLTVEEAFLFTME